MAPDRPREAVFSDHDGLPEFVLRIPALFDVCRSGRDGTQYEGWFPYELLDLVLRQRLEAFTVGPAAGNRDARIAGFKAEVLKLLESRDDTGQIVLHSESDVREYLDPNRFSRARDLPQHAPSGTPGE